MTTNDNLRQPTTTYDNLRQPTTSYDIIQQPTTTYKHLPSFYIEFVLEAVVVCRRSLYVVVGYRILS